MRALLLTFMALMSLAPPAFAQDPPQTQPPNAPSCNHASPSAYFRQTYSAGPGIQMECIRKWGDVSGPAKWPDAEATLSDEERRMGFAVTGGGCEQVAPQCNYPLIMSRPVRDDGWYCRTGDTPGDSGSNEKRVQAFLVACRTKAVVTPLEAAHVGATFSAGDYISVARLGSGLAKPLPVDYTVCNLEAADSGFALEVWWTVPKAPDARPRVALPPQRCLNAGRVSSLMVQNVATQSRALRVTYQRFDGGALPACDEKACQADFAPLGDASPSAPSAPEVPIECLDRSKPGTSPDKWLRYCALKLPTEYGHYRVCYREGNFQGPNNGAWPGHMALLVVNDIRLVDTAPEGYIGNARWSEVIPSTCVDIYDVNKAWILVRGDKNYDARTVSGIKLSIEKLTTGKATAKR